MRRLATTLALGLAVLAHAGTAAAQDSVYLEELTWTEARAAIDGGKTTIILATGGTEQNGPHMVLGKHNILIHHPAGEIARRLGNALVAPVLAYVPEGSVDRPRGHMSKAGTITLPNEHFMKVLEFAARSFRVHGFTDIVLIGDSGGNQNGMRDVAALLNTEWAGSGVRVHHVPEYYSGNGFGDWLESQGHSREEIGSHAGMNDTSQLLAIAPDMVRRDKLAPGGGFEDSGVSGDPTKASAEYGQRGVEMKIQTAVDRIRELVGSR